MIRVEGLTHRYGDRVALDGVSLEVARGEIFGLLGPNGGGKTTLFRILSTLLRPTGGTATVAGRDVGREAGAVRAAIGVVFQSPSLDARLTVEENVRFHAALCGVPVDAPAWLARFGLADRAGDLVKRLSGGLQRRVEIAKALCTKPEVLLLDEPGTGLDPGARREVREALERARGDGATVLLTTHLMDEAERCDRIAILDRGRVAAQGRPAEMRSAIGADVIAVATAEPERLAADVRAKFGVEAAVLDGRVRLERREGAAFVPALVEAFPGRVESVTVGKPTLEDVFLHATGRRFEP